MDFFSFSFSLCLRHSKKLPHAADRLESTQHTAPRRAFVSRRRLNALGIRYKRTYNIMYDKYECIATRGTYGWRAGLSSMRV